jgi:hypothetical protein
MGATSTRLVVLAGGLVLAMVAAVVAVVAFTGDDSTSGGDAGGDKTNDSGWTQVFRDDFDGTAGSLPAKDSWLIDKGTGYPGGADHWGTGEIETYTDSTKNVSLDGKGNLRITPLRDSQGAWTSARIESVREDFQPPQHGTLRVESRVQLPDVTGAQAKGYWSAFWLLGAGVRGNPNSWPGIGEFDVLEHVNGIGEIRGTLHCGTEPGGPCDEHNGRGSGTTCPGSPCAGNFHTYAFEWDRSSSPEELRWYVDGKKFWSVKATDVDAQTWKQAVHNSSFILFNLAIGGDFPNGQAQATTPDAGTKPGVPMVIDYVSVRSRGGTPQATTGPRTGFKASGPIRAEYATSQQGTAVQPSTDRAEKGGGHTVGWLGDGDMLRFDGVTFTGDTHFRARVASGGGVATEGGKIEVRLDSPTAAPIGTLEPGNTGGWQTWKTLSAEIPSTTGSHDVFLTFAAPQPDDFVNLNWVGFS